TRDSRPSAGNDTGLQQKNDTPQPAHQQKHLLKALSPTTENHTSRIIWDQGLSVNAASPGSSSGETEG
ncbi:hypothetical protein AB4039_41690, partial [Streptomyces sp. M-16]|uniref:hypothetical protein n=1 Tax=Streptomyces sp. M-16 TaxID=3233040 RepID=UPI003F96E58C